MKAGYILTPKEARSIAEAGGQVWLKMEPYDPDEESYDGPVSFEKAASGYLLNATGVSEVDADLECDSGLLGDIFSGFDPEVDGVAFPITDIDFNDYEDSALLSEDFGAGRMSIHKIES